MGCGWCRFLKHTFVPLSLFSSFPSPSPLFYSLHIYHPFSFLFSPPLSLTLLGSCIYTCLTQSDIFPRAIRRCGTLIPVYPLRLPRRLSLTAPTTTLLPLRFYHYASTTTATYHYSHIPPLLLLLLLLLLLPQWSVLVVVRLARATPNPVTGAGPVSDDISDAMKAFLNGKATTTASKQADN